MPESLMGKDPGQFRIDYNFIGPGLHRLCSKRVYMRARRQFLRRFHVLGLLRNPLDYHNFGNTAARSRHLGR